MQQNNPASRSLSRDNNRPVRAQREEFLIVFFHTHTLNLCDWREVGDPYNLSDTMHKNGTNNVQCLDSTHDWAREKQLSTVPTYRTGAASPFTAGAFPFTALQSASLEVKASSTVFLYPERTAPNVPTTSGQHLRKRKQKIKRIVVNEQKKIFFLAQVTLIHMNNHLKNKKSGFHNNHFVIM